MIYSSLDDTLPRYMYIQCTCLFIVHQALTEIYIFTHVICSVLLAYDKSLVYLYKVQKL
jgi:hypothetical protein